MSDLAGRENTEQGTKSGQFWRQQNSNTRPQVDIRRVAAGRRERGGLIFHPCNGGSQSGLIFPPLPSSPGTVVNVWRYPGCHNRGQRVVLLLTCSGWGPGTPLSFLQCVGAAPAAKSDGPQMSAVQRWMNPIWEVTFNLACTVESLEAPPPL